MSPALLLLQETAKTAEKYLRKYFFGVGMFTRTLHDLSRLAVEAPLGASTLGLAVQVLRTGAGAKEAHLVYVPAQEYSWASDPPSDQKPIGEGGLRHMERRLAAFGLPMAFNLGKAGRIEGLGPAREAQGCRWVVLPVSGGSDYTDMLLVRGGWSGPVPERVLHLLEASLPALTVLLGRFLDASEARRQREQLNALSEVARAITHTRDMEMVLTRLANSIGSVTEYEHVVLDVLAEDGCRLGLRCLNESRWSESPQVRFWRESGLTDELDPFYLDVASTHQSVMVSDAQHDERLSPQIREFCRASLLVSSAVLPLCYHDEVLGFLTLTSPRPHDFPAEEVQLLEGLAAQAAAAIKAVQNYQELEESRAQLREYAERLQENVQVQHRLARIDALTGIPNRRYVGESLAAQCARSLREGSPLAVVLADVDDFKKVNDTLGHASGDRVLIELAQLARDSCRAMDVAGRYGGDEFIFVLPLSSLEHAAGFAERLRSRVGRKRLCLSTRTTAPVTLSLGVSGLSSERTDPETILQSADEALYRAKALGKNQVCVAEDRARVA